LVAQRTASGLESQFDLAVMVPFVENQEMNKLDGMGEFTIQRHVREHLSDRRTPVQRSGCESTGRYRAQEIDENGVVSVPGVEYRVEQAGHCP
jgi:hypothetical protein